MQEVNFIAIDFETATRKRTSICEAGICVVRPEIWAKIAEYLKECPVLVAHNAAFDIGCIRHSLEFYRIEKPDITFYCSLRAARKLYNFDCNKLDYLCNQFEIPYGLHHRAGDDAEMCARLFLREIRDAAKCNHENMDFCNRKL